ncbi:PBECR4 domain-containing protein [Streptococcus thermophilus]|uniref:PBECR4 domain-containing protein n=1 Tax=Streptococcus thermophilus TaxID=1308 RepID=UPI003A8117AA
MASIEELKQLSILEVAESLGMQLHRTGSHTYAWQEHDSFTINTRDNYFNWFARSTGGDVIKMVQVVQEETSGQDVSFKQAKHFLEDGSFDAVDVTAIPEKEPFHYYLEPYETEFKEGREYLKDVRGLSDETIDFFAEKGVLSQATKKTGDYFEPVLVFKSLDTQNEIIGASLQGIRENLDLYERGRLKQIMRASDGLTGMHVDIGTPKRLVFAEAPIDLMSYYELHQDTLQDVRLVAMDGLKESTVSRHVAELLAETGAIKAEVEQDIIPTFLANMAEVTTFFHGGKHDDFITLAVDNDDAGHTFIERLTAKGIGLTQDLPPRAEGQDKMDWNDYLKESKEKALDRSQEPSNTGGELFNRNFSSLETEVSGIALQPEESKTQPDFPANVQLHFNIDKSVKSSYRLRGGYKYPEDKDIRTLNNYADSLQRSAQQYLDSFSNQKIIYAFNEDDQLNFLEVGFEKRHWMHLTGIMPIYDEHLPSVAEKFIDEVASGHLSFQNVTLGQGYNDKIKVLPMLPELLDSKAFTFNDLSSVQKFKRLELEKGIKPENEDLILALKTDDNSAVPASLMKLTHKAYQTIEPSQRTVLGVFAEKDNQIKTLSINHDFIKDDGKEMLETLRKSREIETLKDEPNLKHGGLTMPTNQDLNLRNRFDQILREKEERKKDQARKDERERDSDGDGISDEQEKNQGTNPLSPDTDGDGKSDNEEVGYGSNPLDVDHPNTQNYSSLEPTKTVTELIEAKDSKGLSQLLKDGVNDYFESDTYKQYLETMSKFHNYSPRNIQLIMTQNPDASHVASFKKWKDDFERNVNKGEKALRIFAPITLKRKDPKTKEPLLDENGNEQTYTSFKLVPVFDVSQTNGKELAKPIYELEGTYEDYGNLYKSAKEVSEANGVPLSFSDDTGRAKGYYSPTNNEIVIKKGLSEQHTLKTIFHEMAHSDLHNLEKLQEVPLKRSTAELQAESVAFVVASHYGLDTSEYSFGYLATWSQDPEGLSDLEAQIKIVQKEADSLISRIDKSLEKYQNKELTKDAFQEKLKRLKTKEKEKSVEPKEKAQAKEAPKKLQKSDNEMNL